MTNDKGIFSDYHMHSTFSVDGRDSIEAMARRALALGFDEIAITEHAEWHPAIKWQFNVDGYLKEIERCRPIFAPLGLTIYSGVELGNPHEYPRQANQLIDDYPFDVRVSSLHWLYGENIHDVSCFNGREPLDVYADYFTSLGYMAADFSGTDIIAHFDRIFWRGYMLGARFRAEPLENIVRSSLATIAWRGLSLEVNTRLLSHVPYWRSELVTMLGWFREEGGRHVVVSSDAHNTGQIGMNLEAAAAVLKEAGLAPGRLRMSPLPA